MKRIKTRNDVRNIKEEDYIGISYDGENIIKGFVIRDEQGWCGIDRLTYDTYNHWHEKSKQDYLHHWLFRTANNTTKAYVFSSFADLLEWYIT